MPSHLSAREYKQYPKGKLRQMLTWYDQKSKNWLVILHHPPVGLGLQYSPPGISPALTGADKVLSDHRLFHLPFLLPSALVTARCFSRSSFFHLILPFSSSSPLVYTSIQPGSLLTHLPSLNMRAGLLALPFPLTSPCLRREHFRSISGQSLHSLQFHQYFIRLQSRL